MREDETGTFTLAHLSDVHLAPIQGFHPRYWNAKRGLGYLNWRRGRSGHHLRSVADRIAADVRLQAADHIAVTGDLVNLGLPGEYLAARAWLDSLGDAARVSLVPGNHDIYTARMHGASCLETWAPFMTSIGDERAAGAGDFPFVRRLGDLAIIGLCSAVPTPPFVASGRLGAKQLAALGAILERLGRLRLARVVLIHHPPLPGQAPPRRALSDAVEMQRVLERHGAELVLHGHNHTETLVFRPAAAGGVPVVGVPSASAGRAHDHEPLARYNLLRFSRDGGRLTIRCRVRGLASADGEIVDLDQRTLMSPPPS